MKKILCVFLSVIMSLCILPIGTTAFAKVQDEDVVEIEYIPDIPIAKLKYKDAVTVADDGELIYDIENCIGCEYDILKVYYSDGSQDSFTCVIDKDLPTGYNFVNENGESYDSRHFAFYSNQEEEPWSIGTDNYITVVYYNVSFDVCTEVVSDSHWVKNGKNWKYRFYGESYAKEQYIEENEELFYFDSDGNMAKGWYSFDDGLRYFSSTGAMQTGWKKLNGYWYYFYNDGLMQTSLQNIDGVRYYFNKSGAMQTGWKRIDNIWHYFNASGEMQTGWKKLEGVWYYFNDFGEMQTQWQYINGCWYYFNSSGKMTTGWQKIGNYWYYMKSSGAMQTGWIKMSGKWYYLESSGRMRTASLTYKGKVYNFSKSGVCLNP